jgi:DNA helicase IV
VPVTAQRERFRRALVHHVYEVYTRGVPLGFDEQELGAELLADPASRKVIDGCWRSVGAVALVRSLLTQRNALARAADGLLEPHEQQRILRPRSEADAWAANDLPLLDEAEALLRGGMRQFDHVVVDEAQDLSPMQLRMLARRARHRSMTVLGDLAQATGPASPGSWEETLEHLGAPVHAQTAELTMGYRLPGAVLSLANRLLTRAAPGVAPSRSVRADGDEPDFHLVAAGELVGQVASHAVDLVQELATVAVIAMPDRVPEIEAAIEALGVALAEPGEVEPDRPIVVVPAPLAKGLEFDGVIVVEPGEIVASGPNGVRLLFVALTRAVQHLAIAYSGDLPAELRP